MVSASAPVPYLDLNGFTARTVMPASDFAIVMTAQPTWFAANEAQVRGLINSRLKKRGYAVPFGSTAPPLFATGTTPPPAGLSGSPTLGSMAIALAILVAGAVGTATFRWSQDGGTTWTWSPTLLASGTTPPAVTASGPTSLAEPGALSVQVTAGGTLGTALFQWSATGGQTWNLNPVLAATGTTPPAVTIAGASSLASPADLEVQITGAGALGTATFQWSLNGGSTWSSSLTAASVSLPGTGLTVTFPPGMYATNNAYVGQGLPTAPTVVLGATGLTLQFPAGTYSTNDAYIGQGILTAATVALPGTGLTVAFPAGTYGADNAFFAPTPVLEIVLQWETKILTYEAYRKRGTDWTLPNMVQTKEDRDGALAEIKEAADSDTGLFDLPMNDASNVSGAKCGGPLFYTETSPYVSADYQEQIGRGEDERSGGWR